MEVAGLAVGVAGLATSLDACINAYDRIQSFRDFGSKARALILRFEATKLRFKEWTGGLQAQNLLDHNGSLRNDPQDELTRKVATHLGYVLSDLDLIARRLSKLAGPELLPGSSKPSRQRRLGWALGGRDRLSDDITDLELMVKALSDLLPVPVTKSTEELWPTTDIGKALQLAEKKSRLREERTKLKSWLDAPPADQVFEICKATRMRNTCLWLTEKPTFQSWLAHALTPDTPNTLWIHGPAGFGKSVLSAFLVEHLSSTMSIAVCHFFCSGSDEALRRTSSILRSCIIRLISKDESAFEHVAESMENSQSRIATETELWKVFSELVRSTPPFCLIVDGFDECFEYENNLNRSFQISRTVFLTKLRTIFCGSSNYLMITSRDEADIRAALLTSTGSNSFNAAFDYSITEDDVKHDIKAFAEDVVHQSLSRKSHELRTEIAQALAERSEGMFLWIRLQQKELRSTMNTAHLRKTVRSLPNGLHNAYDREWIRIQENADISPSDKERSFSILLWTARAVRPLSALELVEALAIRDDGHQTDADSSDYPDDYVDHSWIREEILRFCGSFLIIRQVGETPDPALDTIEPVHHTARAYVSSKLAESETVQLASIKDNRVARLCLRFLSFDSTWKRLDLQDERLAKHPIRQYAALHWTDHIDIGGTDYEAFIDETHRFFATDNPHFQRWCDIYDRATLGWCRSKFGVMQRYHHGARVLSASHGSRAYYASLFGLLPTLQKIMADDPINIYISGGQYHNPLQAACISGNEDIVRTVLNAGFDVNRLGGAFGYPLEAAAVLGYPAIIEILINAGADISCKASQSSPLSLACVCSHIDVIDILLRSGADVNSTDSLGRTPLCIASLNSDEAIVTRLIQARASVSKFPQETRLQPLHYAAMSGNPRIVRKLIAAGADLDPIAKGGITPLRISVDHGHARTLDLLYIKGAKPNTTSNDGTSPLHSACSLGNAAIVRQLLDFGVDPSIVDNNGSTALYLASYYGHADVVEVLCSHGAQVNTSLINGQTPIHEAVSRGDVNMINILLVHGADVDSPRVDGFTTLMSAAISGNVAIAKFLHHRGSNIDRTTRHGETALYLAASAGHADVTRFLLKVGAKPDVTNVNGWCALGEAIDKRHQEIVDILLAAGASKWLSHSFYSIPLLLAVRFSNSEAVDSLLSRPTLRCLDKKQKSPLNSKFKWRASVHDERVNTADIDPQLSFKNLLGETALHLACQRNNLDIMGKLVSCGAVGTGPEDLCGFTPLDWARDYPPALSVVAPSRRRSSMSSLRRPKYYDVRPAVLQLISKAHITERCLPHAVSNIGRLLNILGESVLAAIGFELNISLAGHEKNGFKHDGILCDGCDERIRNCARYVCQSCPETDLCADCYDKPLPRDPRCLLHRFTRVPRDDNDFRILKNQVEYRSAAREWLARVKSVLEDDEAASETHKTSLELCLRSKEYP